MWLRKGFKSIKACLYNLQKVHLLPSICFLSTNKLTVIHLIKKFPAFYEIRRFITAFTTPSTGPYN
jgi:hypothetical protein